MNNGYKELETCVVMLMGLTSSRTVFQPLETNVMVSNMHVTCITFTLWIHIRVGLLMIQTSIEKNAFLWLHVLSTFCSQEEVFEFGEFEDGFIAWGTQPQQTNWSSSCWPWDSFNFQILVVIEELWHHPTSIYLLQIISMCGYTWQIYHSWLASLTKFVLFLDMQKKFKNYFSQENEVFFQIFGNILFFKTK